MSGTDGKLYNTRVFNEDGIYEATFAAKTGKAAEFRAWVRMILKSLRKGEAVLVSPTVSNEAQWLRAEAMNLNAKTRQAKMIKDLALEFKSKLSSESIQTLIAGAAELLMGKPLLPMTEIERTYTATEIAKELGITACKLGKIANDNGLKTDEYGMMVLAKSPYSDQQVPAFRYNENGRAMLMKLVKGVCSLTM